MMTSEKTSTPLIVRISHHIPMVEKILLTTLLIGAILAIMHIDSTVAKFSLLGLAVAFFLLAFRPLDIPEQENEQLGFSELLTLMNVPKVLWISSAVSALGIAFYIFGFENEGYKNMLMIGGMSIGVSVLILVVSLVRGVRHIGVVTPILLRAVPLCLVDFLILYS